MRPNFDLAAAAVLYRIDTGPIVEPEDKSLSEGELAIISQYGKPT